MTTGPLVPPSVPAVGGALAPVAPHKIPWPEEFDDPRTCEDEWGAFLSQRSPELRAELERALSFARTRHGAQTRRGGPAPYWVHLVRVAMELSDWGVDTPSLLVAALLHDTVEDTETRLGEIRAEFGPDVARLVGWMTTPERVRGGEVRAYYARMLREAPDDVLVLKLADRVDNLHSVQALVMRSDDEAFRRWAAGYLERTARAVTPLAERAPSVARAALLAAMADLASMTGVGFTQG